MSVLLLYPSESPRIYTQPHSRSFKPGWMTSPFCLGFLYDPGISHFPRQTSASNTGEHISLSFSHAHTDTHTQSRSVPLLLLQHIQRPQRDHKSTRTSRTGSPHPRRPRIAAGDGALRRNCTGTTGEEFQQLFLLDLKIKELPEAGDPSSLSFHDV